MAKVYVDVREVNEFREGHVNGAINVPLSELQKSMPKDLESIAKDSEIIVYCRSGGRASNALPFLNRYGFSNVTNGINQEHIESEK